MSDAFPLDVRGVSPTTRPVLRRYLLALAVVAAAILLRVWLDPIMGLQGVGIFLVAIIVAAWIGGIGPAVMSVALLHLMHAYAFPGSKGLLEPTLASVVSTTAYYLVGVTVGALSQLREAAQRRARATTRGYFTATVLADKYKGGKLTSPNDVVVKSDGTIWFTDPDYGWLIPEFGHCQPPEQDRNRVYRVVPDTGDIVAVSEDFDKPNGICFSPDERTLYVGDTGMTHGAFRPHRLMAFDVAADGVNLSNARVFAEISPWVPDGFKCDADGNVYVGAGDGVQVFSPAGEMIGKILTPETVGNLSFGMSDKRTLFIGATSSLWSIELNAAGA